MNIGLEIVFVDTPADGEQCSHCEQPIKGVAWNMMLQAGKPENAISLNTVYCTLCKIAYEKGEIENEDDEDDSK